MNYWVFLLILAIVLCRVDVLLLILGPALAFEDGKTRRWLWVTAIAWVIDMLIAHTVWAWFAGRPQRGEWTISHTLERLCVTDGPDKQFYIELARRINRSSPTGRHIKSVADSQGANQ